MIRFACNSCQKVLSAPDEKAGMRFLCPACKNPLEVPAASGQIQAPRPAAPATLTTQAVTPPPPRANTPLGQRVLAESLAIAVATFRQTLKPITLVFEIQRRRRLRKKAGQAQLALGQRAYEAQLGDAKLRGRIQALGERIHGIQDVKGDARPATAERKELILQLAAPLLATAFAPEEVASQHEHARTLQSKLQAQEESLQGALGGLMPPNGLAWRRISIGYTLALLLVAGGGLIFWKAGEGARLARQREQQQLAARQENDEKRQQEDAEWAKKKDTEAIVERCGPSVALIRFSLGELEGRKLEGGGTGFMIRPGVVVTNAHVVESSLPENLTVYFPSAKDIAKTGFTAKILHFDRKRDLAILAVDPKVPPLRLADKFEFKSGKNITIIGCPGVGPTQLENAVNTGNLSTKTEVNKMPFYQLGVSVNHGNSGGPVFDNRGQVIGVVTLKAGGDVQSIGYCIPWKDLKDRVEALEKEDPHRAASVAQSFHGLHVLKERLVMSAQIYSQMADAYTLTMREFLARRRPAAEGINQIRPKVDEAIRKINNILLDSKCQTIGARLVNDSNLPDEPRGKYADLWQTYGELQQLVERPNGDVNVYANKKQELVNRFNAQRAALDRSLGVEADKDE